MSLLHGVLSGTKPTWRVERDGSFRVWKQPPLMVRRFVNMVARWTDLKFEPRFLGTREGTARADYVEGVERDAQGRAFVILGSLTTGGEGSRTSDWYFTAWTGLTTLRAALIDSAEREALYGTQFIRLPVKGLFWPGGSAHEHTEPVTISLYNDLREPMSVWLDQLEEQGRIG